ncbi:MAG: AMP-binding protein, partial [Tepidimonas fonticaldi]|nr:AMP-binding protein [Tepidimonas fonticaldi]
MTTAESATHPPSDAPSAGDDRPHARVWPARVPRTIQPPQTSLWFNLEVSARRYPDKAATVFFDRVMTYPELQRQAERIAAWLAARGVRRGDRVILFLQNCPQFI